jgi:hypothetical protein
MNKFLYHSAKMHLGFAVSLLLLSCNSGDMSIDFDLNQPDNNNVVFIDTMQIQTSVLKSDSIVTSATSSILAGAFYEGSFGSTRSESYFQVSLPSQTISSLGLNEKILYDSVALVLDYEGTYNGDTTQQMELGLYQLKTRPSTSKAYYSTSSLDAGSAALGLRSFKPRPTKDSTLNIRLSDQLGQTLYDFLNGSLSYESDELDRKTKGFVIKAGEKNISSLLNFNVAGSGIRVYTHTEKTLAAHTFDFKVAANAVQFNHFTYNSIFEAVNQLKKPLQQASTDFTNKQGLIKTGVGLYTKFNIPGIRQLKEISKFRNVSRVELKVYALQKSYKESLKVPPSLVLYQLNLSNQIEGSLVNTAGQAVTGTFVYDPGELTFVSYYTFDLTQYFTNILNGAQPNKGFLLTVPSGTDSGKNTNGVMIGAQNHPSMPMEIKVYYTTN